METVCRRSRQWSNGVGKQTPREISNPHVRLVSLQSWLRISIKLVHVMLESAKNVNVYVPILHAFLCVDVVEIVSELYIAVILNFYFLR